MPPKTLEQGEKATVKLHWVRTETTEDGVIVELGRTDDVYYEE